MKLVDVDIEVIGPLGIERVLGKAESDWIGKAAPVG